MVSLGTIERVDLRDVWPNEAQDFTPWLANNLDKLGEALGLDLQLQSNEAPVGSFSLDVLAQVVGSDRPVIIENQLEATNHIHLGQLLTYAAGYDAYAAVWLVREFRDEHRQALDWLNQRTGDDTQFFGVVVEAWSIDNSRPAPHFRVVAMPNDWQKQAISAGPGDSGSQNASGEANREFFQSLIDTLREEHNYTNARKPTSHRGRALNFYSFSSGFRSIYFRASFPRNKASVEVYIDTENSEANDLLFAQLEERKSQIETEIGQPLEWDSKIDRRAVSIGVSRDGSVDDASDVLEELQAWMVERLLTFKRVFTPHLQELVE